MHQLGGALPWRSDEKKGRAAQFAQVYTYDPATAADLRMENPVCGGKLDEEVHLVS